MTHKKDSDSSLPLGSYRDSSRKMHVQGKEDDTSRFTAECRRIDGSWVESSLHPEKVSGNPFSPPADVLPGHLTIGEKIYKGVICVCKGAILVPLALFHFLIVFLAMLIYPIPNAILAVVLSGNRVNHEETINPSSGR